jgi:hypothetical protein
MKSILLRGSVFLILLIALGYPVTVLAQLKTGIQESTGMEVPSQQVALPQGVTHLQLPPFPTTHGVPTNPPGNRGTSLNSEKNLDNWQNSNNLRNLPQPQVYSPSASNSIAPVHPGSVPFYPGSFHVSVPNPLSASQPNSQSIFQGLTQNLLPSGVIPVPGISSWASQAQSFYGTAKGAIGNVQSIPSVVTPWVSPLISLPLSRPLSQYGAVVQGIQRQSIQNQNIQNQSILNHNTPASLSSYALPSTASPLVRSFYGSVQGGEILSQGNVLSLVAPLVQRALPPSVFSGMAVVSPLQAQRQQASIQNPQHKGNIRGSGVQNFFVASASSLPSYASSFGGTFHNPQGGKFQSSLNKIPLLEGVYPSVWEFDHLCVGEMRQNNLNSSSIQHPISSKPSFRMIQGQPTPQVDSWIAIVCDPKQTALFFQQSGQLPLWLNRELGSDFPKYQNFPNYWQWIRQGAVLPHRQLGFQGQRPDGRTFVGVLTTLPFGNSLILVESSASVNPIQMQQHLESILSQGKLVISP